MSRRRYEGSLILRALAQLVGGQVRKTAPPNLSDIEPEPPGELELLLVAVVHKAHDDVALVDGLENNVKSKFV